jgi:transposase InsO family protein
MAITEDEYFENFPLSYAHLDKAQRMDPSIMKILKMDNSLYHEKNFHGGGKTRSLVCFRDKIVVPKKLQKHATAWYHNTLCHPGINRTEETIGQHLWWPKQREFITQYVKRCPTCQRNKRKKLSYGHVPAKEAETVPWDKLCVDLIGPYKIRRKGRKDLVCKAVTMIDPATGWFEICQYDDKKSITVANIVEQEWFCRYPWPTQITFDRGSEFIGEDFQTMIKDSYGIQKKPITVRNPQANAVVERIHQVIANMVRTFELENNYLDEEDPWKGILSAVAFAVRSTFHTTLRKTPGQLVYGRDMIFNVQHQADWKYIQDRKQRIINKNNKQENKKRIPHTYKVGDLVLLKKGTEHKYETPYDGPFPILQVNDNGTVRLKVKSTIDTYNIRRLYPYTDQDHGGECSMHNNRRKRLKMSEGN